MRFSDVAQHKMDVRCEPPRQWRTSELVFLLGKFGYLIFDLIFVYFSYVFLFWCGVVLLATSWIWKYKNPERKTIIDTVAESLSLQHNLRKCLRTTRKRTVFHSMDGLQVISLALLINGNIFFLVMEYLGLRCFFCKSCIKVYSTWKYFQKMFPFHTAVRRIFLCNPLLITVLTPMDYSHL